MVTEVQVAESLQRKEQFIEFGRICFPSDSDAIDRTKNSCKSERKPGEIFCAVISSSDGAQQELVKLPGEDLGPLFERLDEPEEVIIIFGSIPRMYD